MRMGWHDHHLIITLYVIILSYHNYGNHICGDDSYPSISDSEAFIFDVTNRSTTELNRIDIAVSEQERRLITFLGGVLGNGAKKIT